MDTISFGDSKIIPLGYKYYKSLLRGKNNKNISDLPRDGILSNGSLLGPG